MGVCASCYANTNNDNEQKVEECNGEEGEEDKLDQGGEEDSQDALLHHDRKIHQEQRVHHHDHYHFHQHQGRKSMCRRCNLRLLTLIHVPPKEARAAAAAVDENSGEEPQRAKRNLGSKPFTLCSSVQGSQISRAPAGDTSDKVEEADIVNYSEHGKPRKPHRDLHVSWRKGHGDFIDHLMFGWHH